MPTPHKGESRSDFVKRCIPIVMKEGATQEQAVGKCEGMYTHYKAKHGLTEVRITHGRAVPRLAEG